MLIKIAIVPGQLARTAVKIAFAAVLFTSGIAWATTTNFPERESPIPQTTNGVPHVQIGIEVKPEIYTELLQRVAQMPNVEIRDTIISLPGARGFWISENVELARPEAIVRGREFAHVHPDGSLHASLPIEVAAAAVTTGWATPHPWAGSRSGWEGFVMIYTPSSKTELDTVMRLVTLSYKYVTGNP